MSVYLFVSKERQRKHDFDYWLAYFEIALEIEDAKKKQLHVNLPAQTTLIVMNMFIICNILSSDFSLLPFCRFMIYGKATIALATWGILTPFSCCVCWTYRMYLSIFFCFCTHLNFFPLRVQLSGSSWLLLMREADMLASISSLIHQPAGVLKEANLWSGLKLTLLLVMLAIVTPYWFIKWKTCGRVSIIIRSPDGFGKATSMVQVLLIFNNVLSPSFVLQ